MKKAGLFFAFTAVLTLAIPPTLHAECYTYPNRSIHYFPECDCKACAGWAFSNCYECAYGDGTWCQGTHPETCPLHPEP